MPQVPRGQALLAGQTYLLTGAPTPGCVRQSDLKRYYGLLGELVPKYEICLHNFALTTEWIGLVVRPRRENLSAFMQQLQGRFSKQTLGAQQTRGHLWRRRFDHLALDTDFDVLHQGLGLDRHGGPWSSRAHYASGQRDSLITDSPLYKFLGTTPTERQSRYRLFLS